MVEKQLVAGRLGSTLDGPDGSGGEAARRWKRRGGQEARVRGSLSSRDGREEGVTGVQAASADCFI